MTEQGDIVQRHPGGRPTLYDEAYCDQVVEHMKNGASLASFAAEIDVARSTINVWMEAHPEFLEAVMRGKAKCAAWWEKTGRALAQTGVGNATMCVFGLKNMSDGEWNDKQLHEHTGKDGAPITIDLSKLSDAALAEIERAASCNAS